MDKASLEKETKIGMVFLCCDWETRFGHARHCGVLIGIYGTKIYYFEKEEEIKFKRYELVSFLEDKENPNVAIHVLGLSKCEIERKKHRCFDKISWANEIATKLFFESKKYENETTPTYAELKIEIVRLEKYINELDSTSIIRTFTIKKRGYLQSRVGKDDHFHYSTTRSVDSDDLYINHLLQTGENSGYECTNSYEENYDYFDEKEAQKCIQEALSLYDKEGHLAFLLNRFIEERYGRLFRKAEIQNRLEGLFNVNMVWNAIDCRYWGEYEYYDCVVTKYNMRNNGAC